MKTRERIIFHALRDHEVTTGGPDAYSPIIRAELEKRLTEPVYLTCDDFDHFDVPCGNCCCHEEPHYEMADVILSDDRHAWVCCTIRQVLMRETATPNRRDEEEVARLFKDMFRRKDPIAEEIHRAKLTATSDEERLYCTLKYIHHQSGRKRGHKKLETLVQRALSRPGRGQAKAVNVSSRPESCGFCWLCGASIYKENLIPYTPIHNCATGRKQQRESPWNWDEAVDLDKVRPPPEVIAFYAEARNNLPIF